MPEQAPTFKSVIFDFPSILAKITEVEGWSETDGPESNIGLDYCLWFEAGGQMANVNLGQAALIVILYDQDENGDPAGEGERIYSGCHRDDFSDDIELR